jgi:myo-inositol-1-phosphate synthase
MKIVNYSAILPEIKTNGEIVTTEEKYSIKIPNVKNKIGVMLVGWGGNNGSTLTAGLLAYTHKIKWANKSGIHGVQFLGSVSQFGSVHLGYDNENKSHSRLFKNVTDLCKPEDIVIGGWDICKDDLYTASKKTKVIDHDLLNKLEDKLKKLHPLPSIYNNDFIANNQNDRANNTVRYPNLNLTVKHIINDIKLFKSTNNLEKVIILWTASTERFHNGKWTNKKELDEALLKNDKEISPSILFAIAAAQTGCTFINGSPQNTLCPAIIDYAKHFKTFVGGEDFKTGQTKLKSVLVDWFASSGIRPLSIVSYNHLGNNDGKNLEEAPQFQSKELTKKNVIDDVVSENPELFPNGNPDHTVVIKYIPSVGDSKRAMDEYYSELFLDGRNTLIIHNTCEDSLLAVPLMLDIIIFSEFFTRIIITKINGEEYSFNPELSFLSLFFKAPIVNPREPLINAFFKQKMGLENFFRILLGLPTADYIHLNKRITK